MGRSTSLLLNACSLLSPAPECLTSNASADGDYQRSPQGCSDQVREGSRSRCERNARQHGPACSRRRQAPQLLTVPHGPWYLQSVPVWADGGPVPRSPCPQHWPAQGSRHQRHEPGVLEGRRQPGAPAGGQGQGSSTPSLPYALDAMLASHVALRARLAWFAAAHLRHHLPGRKGNSQLRLPEHSNCGFGPAFFIFMELINSQTHFSSPPPLMCRSLRSTSGASRRLRSATTATWECSRSSSSSTPSGGRAELSPSGS